MSTPTIAPHTAPAVFADRYPLPDSAAADYARDGHTFLPGVLPAEDAERCRSFIREAAQTHGQKDLKPLQERDTYGKAFQQHTNLWRHDPRVREFVLAERFAGIAAGLMGVERVRIYHDQALYKEAGGGPTPWHQDHYYWPIDTSDTITMWMPLVDIGADMGMLTFASRSHRKGYLGTLPISDKSEQVFREYVDQNGFEIVRRDSMSAGDATFHSGWNLHSAPGNESELMREVITVIYIADGARVTEPINDNQRNDLAAWLPGQQPGDLVGSELNPIAGA
jgi:ectoine hydroxylase-related dioxygenase (phytanoyl-CoA dioxygenase family)